jgi:hypothetical protein
LRPCWAHTKNGTSKNLVPFCLKFLDAPTITNREHQTIKLADHTHLYQTNDRDEKLSWFSALLIDLYCP